MAGALRTGWQRDPRRRTRPRLDAGDSELFQLTLYRDDLPDTYFAFEGGHLVRHHRRPVVELSVTYEPALGVIEVVSPDRAKRDELARLFADTVLGNGIERQRIQCDFLSASLERAAEFTKRYFEVVQAVVASPASTTKEQARKVA